jgi:hypothetical protein
MGAELAPVECPEGHRQPIRLPIGVPHIPISVRCRVCAEIHTGYLVVRIVHAATFLTIARDRVD